MCIYLYIYINMCVYVCVYIYTYAHTYSCLYRKAASGCRYLCAFMIAVSSGRHGRMSLACICTSTLLHPIRELGIYAVNYQCRARDSETYLGKGESHLFVQESGCVETPKYAYYFVNWVISPPLIINPPLIKKPFGGISFYYQFRRRHDYPPHKWRFLVRSTPLIIKPP